MKNGAFCGSSRKVGSKAVFAFSDLGCYGGEIQTPNHDKLAAGGLRFTQFYNSAKCEPTRASLMSGQYWQD